MSNPIFVEVMTLLAISVVAVVVFQRLRMPSSLGYLLVGALVGPHAIGRLHAVSCGTRQPHLRRAAGANG